MSALSIPTVDDVEIDYRAYEQPVVAGHYNGKPILHDGRLCAKWRTPEGETLAAIASVRSEPAPEDLDSYAARLVEAIAERYRLDTG